MAEQESKPIAVAPTEIAPTAAASDESSHAASPAAPTVSRRLLPLGLGLVALLVGCFWWGSQPAEPTQSTPSAQTQAQATPVLQSTATSRSPQSSAALTRVASSLAQAQQPLPTLTPTPVAANSALVPLPTLTPTIVPSPVATRTIELNGTATLRLQLQNETFATDGQPVTIALEPRSYGLGGDSMIHSEQWCEQIGPAGLVFDLTYTLNSITEDLLVSGDLLLYDGFCGEWGSLGNVLAGVPLDVNVPLGTSVLLAPSLQFQGSLMGVPNLLDVTTSVALELSIRNPISR